MTHPATPEVGGEPTAPADPFEAIADEMLGTDEQQDEEQQPADEVEDEAPEAEAETEEAEDEIEVEAEELPPIDPPNSWTAEEKEEFAKLPREVQETLTRREQQREKFVQTKAQEAAQARQTAAAEAAQQVVELQNEYVKQLEAYAEQFAVPEPDITLMVSDNPADRALYAQQMRAKQYSDAQRAAAQRQADEARQQQAQYQEALAAHEAQQFRQRIAEALPDFFDETKGPELKEKLTATAKAIGFSDEQIYAADADQIIALNTVAQFKAKAEKYDALMKKQMERVRQGKNPPPISRPGVVQNPEAKQKKVAEAAWQRAKNSQGAARVDAFAEYLQNTGRL
jgi:hypothetical protein